MSKIFEALENAERQRGGGLKKGSSLVLEPKEEKKSPLAPEPKEERMERPKVVHRPIRPDRMRSDLPLVSLFQPGSLGAEQFRRLRTHVLKLNISDPPKTIMVTSATEGEGKTFVAANLAAGIAHDLFWSTVTFIIPLFHTGLVFRMDTVSQIILWGGGSCPSF